MIFADKICTDEETVRLRSHIEATRKELTAGGSVGRKLDFIAQEMNREANTILSKANDLEVSDCAIALKTEIEKSESRFRILNSRSCWKRYSRKAAVGGENTENMKYCNNR